MHGSDILIVLAALAILAWFAHFFSSRSRALLEKWAGENQYHLSLAELRLFRRGPFLWSGKGHAIYRVEIHDQHGDYRKGWVRCGSWLAGLLSDQVEERWDN